MSILGSEDISFSKEEVKEERGSGTLNTSKTVIFKHEANAGDLVINTTSLVVPAEAASNGFTQPSAAEIASINMLVNKSNLKIHSSRGIWLQLYEDFIISSASQIMLIGNIADLGGALVGEVFTVYAAPILSNSIVTTDHKKMYQEYVLANGQTVLNLGREYEVGRNVAVSQIGAIRVFRNGIGPQLRNVANAAAAPLADGNYHENDAGNGLGTSLEFNVAAVGSEIIVVEFGLEYAGDLSMVGDIESLYGAVLKLADDVKDLGPYPITRYLTANPSEVERRAFGDQVFDHEARITGLELPDIELSLESGNGFGAVGTFIRRFLTVRKNTLGTYATYLDDSNNGGSVTVNKKGRWSITYSDSNTGAACNYGVSVNASSLVASVVSLGYAGGLRMDLVSSQANFNAWGTVVLNLNIGDVVRAHAGGGVVPNTGVNTRVILSMTYMGPGF